MPGSQLSRLPLEIIIIILSQLSFRSLLSFGKTSRANYTYHILCMRRLHLAVFQKRIHALIAFLDIDSSWINCQSNIVEDSTLDRGHQIPIVLPQSTRGKEVIGCKSVLRRRSASSESRKQSRGNGNDDIPRSAPQTIRLQNEIFAKIVNRYGNSLVDLEFLAYDLNIQGATAIASNCQGRLRHLGLRFEHPHIRDSMLSRSYWLRPPEGSTAWNSLIGVGEQGKNIGLTRLESLVLERGSITPWQLCMLVKRNVKLKDIRLRNCSAVQPEFLNWLGGLEADPEEPHKYEEVAPGASIQVLWLENCDSIRSERLGLLADKDDEKALEKGLEWVRALKSLKSISFRQCPNVDPDLVEKANETIWRLPEVVLPYPVKQYNSEPIEVDPDYV
ncbi:hypothetical protein V8E54_004128 [Elaphomyces granulatus]